MIDIALEKLKHHPMNPRKDYGDLEELQTSLLAVGVLQPLTVVPDENEPNIYNVVIGNRRLEAARNVDLKYLPCEIKELNHEEIMAFMMTENIIRENLTAYDEAEGFQTMLDLGKSVKTVANIYGFSESTVRKRVNLLSLDKDKFKQATERGATLFDMSRVEEIEDEAERKRVLDKAGTKDFENTLRAALQKQKEKAYLAEAEEFVREFALEMDHLSYKDGKSVLYAIPAVEKEEQCEPVYVTYKVRFSAWEMKDLVFDRENDAKYYFLKDSSGIIIYQEIDPNYVAPKSAEAILKEKVDVAVKGYNDMREITEKRCLELRNEFIKSFKPKKEHLPALWKFLSEVINNKRQVTIDDSKLLGLKEVEVETSWGKEKVVSAIDEKNQLNYLIRLAFSKCGGTRYISENYWDSEYHVCLCRYHVSEELITAYEFLRAMGYEPSEEEEQLLNGTHIIYDISWINEYYPKKEEVSNV